MTRKKKKRGGNITCPIRSKCPDHATKAVVAHGPSPFDDHGPYLRTAPEEQCRQRTGYNYVLDRCLAPAEPEDRWAAVAGLAVDRFAFVTCGQVEGVDAEVVEEVGWVTCSLTMGGRSEDESVESTRGEPVV